MSKTKLNKKQKKAVEQWGIQKRVAAKTKTKTKTKKIVDRTCGYKDAYIEWTKQFNQSNNKIAIVTYSTRLEMTKLGKIRVEETEIVNTISIDGYVEGESVPLFDTKIPVPKTKIVNSLFPKDRFPKDRNVEKKIGIKNRQLTLPISQTEQRLLEISQDSGDKAVYAKEDLLAGTEPYFCLYFNKEVYLPKPIIILLREYNCSINEWETVAMLAGVMSPQNLLFWVEQIPQMRKASEFTTFKESASNLNLTSESKVKPVQSQKVSF